ncbi:MAG: hypothetical protein QMB63_04395 [Clostridiaceae bacterium]
MPRAGRKKDDFGIYHITQKSAEDKILFETDNDRQQFLKILDRSRDKNNFKIYSFCLTKPDEYHIIIDSNGCDISKIMREVNISFSIYKECRGCLFKDRFKSELLDSQFEITDKTFKMDDTKNAGEYFHSACLSMNRIIDESNIRLDEVISTFEKGLESNCGERILTIDSAALKLEELVIKEGLTISDLKKHKEKRNQLIKEMRTCSNLSLKDIGVVFGGLSESTVSKIINSL